MANDPEIKTNLTGDASSLNRTLQEAVRSAKGFASGMSSALAGINAGFNQVILSTSRFHSASNIAFGFFAGNTISEGIESAVRSMGSLVRIAVDFNATIELQKLGIASIVAATNDIVDAQGRQLQGMEKIVGAQVIAEDLFKKIQRDAILTVATTQQLFEAYQNALGPAMAAGLTLDQTRTVTRDIVLAWTAMGRPMQYAAQEARALLTGSIDRNAELARALQITGAQIEQMKREGKLYEFLTDKFKDFSNAAEITAKTFRGLRSSMIDIGQILLGKAFESSFEFIRKEMDKLVNKLMNTEGIKEEWINLFEDIGRSVQLVTESLFAFGKGAVTALTTATKPLVEFLGYVNETKDATENLKRVFEAIGSLTIWVGLALALRGIFALIVAITKLKLITLILLGGATVPIVFEFFGLGKKLGDSDFGKEWTKDWKKMMEELNQLTPDQVKAGREQLGITLFTQEQYDRLQAVRGDLEATKRIMAEIAGETIKASNAQSVFFDNQLKNIKSVVRGMKADTYGDTRIPTAIPYAKKLSEAEVRDLIDKEKFIVQTERDRIKTVEGLESEGRQRVLMIIKDAEDAGTMSTLDAIAAQESNLKQEVEMHEKHAEELIRIERESAGRLLKIKELDPNTRRETLQSLQKAETAYLNDMVKIDEDAETKRVKLGIDRRKVSKQQSNAWFEQMFQQQKNFIDLAASADEEATRQRIVMAELGNEDILGAATIAYTEQLALTERNHKRELELLRIQREEVERFKIRNPDNEAEYQGKLDAIDIASAAADRKRTRETFDLWVGYQKKATDIAQEEVDAMTKGKEDEQKKLSDITSQWTSTRIRISETETILRLEHLIKMHQGTQKGEEAITAKVIEESNNRIAAYQHETDKRLEQKLVEADAILKIDIQNATRATRERDIQFERDLLNMKLLTESATQETLRKVTRQIDLEEARGEAHRLLLDQILRREVLVARESGDAWGVFTGSFIREIRKQADSLKVLEDAARKLAQTVTTELSTAIYGIFTLAETNKSTLDQIKTRNEEIRALQEQLVSGIGADGQKLTEETRKNIEDQIKKAGEEIGKLKGELKTEFDIIETLWDNMLQAMLKAASDFLAAEAMQALFDLGSLITGGSQSSSTPSVPASSSSSSSSSDTESWIVRGIRWIDEWINSSSAELRRTSSEETKRTIAELKLVNQTTQDQIDAVEAIIIEVGEIGTQIGDGIGPGISAGGQTAADSIRGASESVADAGKKAGEAIKSAGEDGGSDFGRRAARNIGGVIGAFTGGGLGSGLGPVGGALGVLGGRTVGQYLGDLFADFMDFLGVPGFKDAKQKAKAAADAVNDLTEASKAQIIDVMRHLDEERKEEGKAREAAAGSMAGIRGVIDHESQERKDEAAARRENTAVLNAGAITMDDFSRAMQNAVDAQNRAIEAAAAAEASLNEAIDRVNRENQPTEPGTSDPGGGGTGGPGGTGSGPGGDSEAYALGGLVAGVPTGVDNILALLGAGEFVVNAQATKRFLPLLQRINRYARGGAVGGSNIRPPYSADFSVTGQLPARIEQEVFDFFRNFEKALRDAALEIASTTGDLNAWTLAITLYRGEIEGMQHRIDALRVDLLTAVDPEEAKKFAQELTSLVSDRYQTEMDFAKALGAEVDRLNGAFTNSVNDLVDLALAFGTSSTGMTELSNQLIALAGLGTTVANDLTIFTSQVTLLSAGLKIAAQSGVTAGSLGQIVSLLSEVPAILQSIVATTDPSLRQEQLQALSQSLQSLLDGAINANKDYYAELRDAAQEASDERLEALQDERDAIEEANEATLEGLNEQLDLVRKWGGIVESIKEQLLGLSLGNLGTTNPLDALTAAQAHFQEVLAEFRANATPEGAAAVQAAANQVLDAATEVFTRPSPEYQALFASIVAVLEEIQGVAEGQLPGVTEADLLSQIAEIEERQEELLTAIDEQIEYEQTAITAHLEALTAQEAAADVAIRATFESSFAQLSTAMFAVAGELLADRNEAMGRLREIIGDQTLETYLAMKQAELLVALNQIHLDLAAALVHFGVPIDLGGTGVPGPRPGGDIPPRGEPGPPPPKGDSSGIPGTKGMYLSGTDYVPVTGLALLHRGELVMDPSEASSYRRKRGNVKFNVSYSPTIVIQDARDPDATAEAVSRVLERDIRSGRLGAIIVKRVKGT